MARHWMVIVLTLCVVIILYSILFNATAFLQDGYMRYKMQELELQNNTLLIKQNLMQKKNGFNDSTEDYSPYINKDILCDLSNIVPKCETIHVAMVCTKYKSSRLVVTLLKSLLFYRTNPIHFHILVDEIAHQILEKLFDTWNIPQVNVSLYNTKEVIPSVNWIPNNHYSGIYGLLKLTLPKILPNHLEKIIVMDTDLTFATNIAELWALFSKFNDKHAIGLVENQSNWYIGKKNTWPAIGRGFNTGVVMFNLKRLKEIQWSKLWHTVAIENLRVYSSTALADQDILNALIKRQPDLVFQLPCQWNVQLSDNTLSEKCYENYDVKVIHWNSPKKLDVQNKHVNYFKSIYYTFLEFNGNLLRRGLYSCSNMINTTEFPADKLCSEFQKVQNSKWRTHIFIREFSYKPAADGVDITLLAQLSIDRLQMVEELCKHWEGPMSMTIYATDPEAELIIDYIEHSEILKDRYNIAYHMVYKEGHFYPVNLLRNVGLNYVNTKYVFLTDIDFLPMHGLYSHLKTNILFLNNKMDKIALVIPAFETQRYRSSFPRNKIELLKMLDTRSLFTFRYHVWAKGHAPTNYTKWRNAKTLYKVKWVPDYEPYIVVDKSVPEYDTRFVGFGWNKVSHIMELEAQDYEFMVLPGAFIVHMPHAPSRDIARFRTSPQYRMCLTVLKKEFVNNLTKKYGKTFNNSVQLH